MALEWLPVERGEPFPGQGVYSPDIAHHFWTGFPTPGHDPAIPADIQRDISSDCGVGTIAYAGVYVVVGL